MVTRSAINEQLLSQAVADREATAEARIRVRAGLQTAETRNCRIASIGALDSDHPIKAKV